MTYIRDLEPFTLPSAEPEDGLTAVGWLAGGHPFARGDVPAKFVEALRELCRHPVHVTRGYVPCPFCAPRSPGLPADMTMVDSAAGRFGVGHAEIRVEDAGRRYAAPNMIIHYVETHRYAPPPEFVAAVLRTARG